jgi:hypothetical protein
MSCAADTARCEYNSAGQHAYLWNWYMNFIQALPSASKAHQAMKFGTMPVDVHNVNGTHPSELLFIAETSSSSAAAAPAAPAAAQQRRQQQQQQHAKHQQQPKKAAAAETTTTTRRRHLAVLRDRQCEGLFFFAHVLDAPVAMV